MTANSNLDEYADPILYDCENSSFEPDGPFYLSLIQRLGGPVLELGCGTGRITIPFARHGVVITGLDLVPQMLAHARSKAPGLPIQWIEADVRQFQLARPFHFIFESGATFQHMLTRTDQEAMLAHVREHLTSDGHFVVSTIFPTANLMSTDLIEQEWFSCVAPCGREVRVSGTQYYDAVRQIKTETAIRRWQSDDGQHIVRHAPLMLRYTFPQELEALLYYNGFTIVEQYGDTDFSLLTNESKHIIYVCQKRIS